MTETIMKMYKYKEIIKFIESNKEDNLQKKLMEHFSDIQPNTLGSIYSQEIQRLVKRNYHRLNAPDTALFIYHRYLSAVDSGQAPGILVKLARELDYSPAMLAKLVLEQNLLKNQEAHPVSKSQVNRLLRDTTLIQNRDLSYEVYLCLLQDDVYGPFADSIKHSVGHEYEFRLREELKRLKINFHDEDELRNRGYDKTPDIKLDLPIAVDGKVINWIESKASFGDEDSHRVYLKDQFWSYWNRFGPGLVIYWFGFIDELDQHLEKGIMLKSSFPTNITLMDPLSIMSKYT